MTPPPLTRDAILIRNQIEHLKSLRLILEGMRKEKK
jgi:hypothetical protein